MPVRNQSNFRACLLPNISFPVHIEGRLSITTVWLTIEKGRCGMVHLIARNWFGLGLRGAITLTLGIIILIWPELTVEIFLLAFGIYALLDGVFSLVSARNISRRGGQWLPKAIRGSAALGIGLVTLFWPRVTAVVLVYLIAAWAVITGIFEILAAFEFRHQITGAWLVAIIGGLSLAFGFLLILSPFADALSLATVIGTYFLIIGVLWLLLAYQVQRSSRRVR